MNRFGARWTAPMLAGALALCGCEEMAFKSGAGPDAFKADSESCHVSDGTPAGYKSCMAAKGWAIAGLSGADEPPTVVAAASAPTAASTPTVPAAAAAPMPSAAQPARPIPAQPQPAAAPSEPAVDPMAPVTVSAWFKFGGSDPKEAIAACVAELGPAYQPAPDGRTVSTALVACMRKKGWFAA